MPSFSNKAQFFILTTVVIIGMFYALSRYINPFSFIDTSKAIRGSEVFFFDNIKEKTIKTINESSPNNLANNLQSYKSFAQDVAREKGYILSYEYDIGSTAVNVSMSLTSQKMSLKSDFTVQRP